MPLTLRFYVNGLDCLINNSKKSTIDVYSYTLFCFLLQSVCTHRRVTGLASHQHAGSKGLDCYTDSNPALTEDANKRPTAFYPKVSPAKRSHLPVYNSTHQAYIKVDQTTRYLLQKTSSLRYVGQNKLINKREYP